MSIGSIFNNGVKGMTASQLQTATAANNVANAATVGYTRREATVVPDQALLRGDGAKRVVEPFIEKRMLSSQSASGEAQAERVAVDVLDSVFTEEEGNLGPALDAFQVAMQSLASRPEDPASRQQVLTSANALSTAFQNTAAQIDSARADANGRIIDSVAQVNQRLTQIGKLGTEIQNAEVAGAEASDLRDQRAQLIREVAERVPVTVLDQGNGAISLTLGGSHQLVSPEGKVGDLSTSVGNDGSLRIEKVTAGVRVDVTDSVRSGSIGGQLKARDGALKDAKQKLDQLASDVATAYNNVHRQGVGLDGVGDRDLFRQPASVTDAAKNFAVSAAVAGSPEKIAAATDSTKLPSDNTNALDLASISSAPLAFGGMTVSEALASLTGFAGAAVQSAQQSENFATGALAQVESLQQSVSGVSSDEEMVAMMKYQRAYQASLKVIQVADEMMSDLLRLRG